MKRDTQVHTKFAAEFTNIIFMVIAVIQSLAFQDLGQRLAEILPNVTSAISQRSDYGETVLICECIFAFCLIMRVFQTYITVGLDYNIEFISFLDVVVILLVGLVEHLAIAQIGNTANDPKNNPRLFYVLFGALSILGSMIYYWNVHRVDRLKYSSKRSAFREKQLQWQNGTFMMCVSLSCGVGAWRAWSPANIAATSLYVKDAIALCGGLFLVVATANSLSKTFGLQLQRIDLELITYKIELQPMLHPMLEAQCHAGKPIKADSASIAHIVSNQHGRALSALFGLNKIETPMLFDKIVSSRGVGSWNQWAVYLNHESEIVGTALVWQRKHSFIRCVITWFTIFLYSGHVLALHIRRNALGQHLLELPMKGHDWWIVPCIAVKKHNDAGSILLFIVGDLLASAKRNPKINKLKAWCRESNLSLQIALESAGFQRHHEVETEIDAFVEEGRLFIYEIDVSTAVTQDN